MSDNEPLRRGRPRFARLLAVTAATTLVATLAPGAARAAGSDAANVGFGGSLVGTQAYTTAGDEVLRGTLRRMDGGEEQLAGVGVRLAGGSQGIRVEPSELSLGADTATTGFLAEMRFTPAGGAGELATLFSAGGGLQVRAQGGSLSYGFDYRDGASWTRASRSVPLPTAGTEHNLALDYRPTGGGGAALRVWLDGTELPTAQGAPFAVADPSAFGFGNDVHSSAGNRGFPGDLRRIRLAPAPASAGYDNFEFQPSGPTEPEPEPECTPLNAEPSVAISVSPADCTENIVRKASLIRPTPQQYAWQRDELSAFIHFGINTFYDQEWGHGTEDPARFDPTDLDTDQWARELADAGFQRVILTVKHHDGFLLYPSRYSDHSVAASPWRDGRGDLVREFVDSARKYDLKIGFYLSPADSNQELKGVFGNGSPRSERVIPTPVPGDDRTGGPTFTYQATDYGAYFLNTLYEVLTQYGEVSEVWFDGAQGNTGATETYDYEAFYDLIGELQPDAVIAVGGNDVRWVGNEAGIARENEWGPVPVRVKASSRVDYADTYDNPATGSRENLIETVRADQADEIRWWPAEADFKLTQGWFAHPNDRPKSTTELMDIYEKSVGRNSVFLMNVPPTTTGRFSEASVAALRAFRTELDRVYGTDLAAGRPVITRDTAERARAGRAVGERTAITDGDPLTAWSSGQGGAGSVEIDLGGARRVSRFRLAEEVSEHGQQVESFTVEARVDGQWRTVAERGSIGMSRIIRLDTPVNADKVRVSVTGSRAPAYLAQVSVYG